MISKLNSDRVTSRPRSSLFFIGMAAEGETPIIGTSADLPSSPYPDRTLTSSLETIPNGSPTNANQRDLWLKACLVLEVLTICVRPFVGRVMEKFHKKARISFLRCLRSPRLPTAAGNTAGQPGVQRHIIIAPRAAGLPGGPTRRRQHSAEKNTENV